MLSQIYAWLDVVFFTLYPIIVVALAVHFLGNVLTGRAYKRFVLWQWPEHEGPHPPALPKFLHFVHLVCIGLLVLTGMLIKYNPINRPVLQIIHYVAMIIVTVNLVQRLWYAFYSRARDYREFVITRRDIVTAPKVVAYYIFMRPSKPHLGKYNVMQKGTYILFVPMLILQAFTGFALLTKPEIAGVSIQQALIGWNFGAVMGLAWAEAWMRLAHYILNWLFIIFVTIHVYLSVSEDFAAFLDFFGLGFLDKRQAHGDGHGEADRSAKPMAPTSDLPTPRASSD